MLSASGLSPRFPGDLLGLPAFWGGPRRDCVSGSPWAGALTVLFTLPYVHWGFAVWRSSAVPDELGLHGVAGGGL